MKPLARNFIRYLIGNSVRPLRSPGVLMSRPTDVPVLRCGVIGLGRMGRTHVAVLRQHPYFSIAGIASRNPAMQRLAEELHCDWFDSGEEMIKGGTVEVVVIATPHWQHAELAIAALGADRHVVCEKPLAVTVSEADRVLNAARRSKGLLTAVFQTRFEPVYLRAKALLAGGELGPIVRSEILETFWRSDAYYRSDSWRGTWKGEGGGVLVNQAPHILDRYLWLCGVPKTITALCDTTLHQIEVEDIASAVMRHDDGRHGYIHANTTESPWLSRMVIACDRGRVTIQNGRMRVERLDSSIRVKTAAAATLFDDFASRAEDIPDALIDSPVELLSRMYENIALAVAGRKSLLITAADAAHGVELGSAMLLSSANGRSVDLPLDRAAYDGFMGRKVSPGD